MEFYELLLPLALILFLSKLLGLWAQKISMPNVVGMLVAGILIGLLKYIPGIEDTPIYEMFFSETILEGYNFLAKIGVVLIMFSAGMETNLKQIKETGIAAIIITCLGVIVPMFFGFLVAFLFDYCTPIDLVNGGSNGTIGEVNILSDIFYGSILTATSVSITVATLKELGKLNSKFGTAIVSAAVIDDVIGVIILSVLTGINSSSANSSSEIFGTWNNPGALLVVIKIILFFVLAIGLGILIRKIFKKLSDKYPHHRRLPIFAISVGFLYAYIAEKVFGVADITGAYIAGILLSGMKETDYEEKRVDRLGYLIFTPVFFANIGISNINFGAFGGIWLGFGLLYVLAALLGKLFGCGFGGLLTKFNMSDSIKIGLGMMVRAEVVLVCTQKGIDSGLVSNDILTYVCLIIIISSLLSPFFIKLISKKDDYKLEITK